MTINTIYPNGIKEITVPATESIAIANHGGGMAKIYYLVTNANFPNAWQFQQNLEDSSVTLGAFADGKTVKIEANNSTVTYEVGTAPSTASGDADTLGGNPPGYYAADSLVVYKAGTQSITGVKTFASTATYFGVDGGGNSQVAFWDDTNDTWRTLKWDDSDSEWQMEDSTGTHRRVFTAGNLSTDDTLAGDSNTIAVSESAVKGYVDGTFKADNLLINPLFQINQRVWASGANLATTGDYFVDRWCAGTDNSAPTLSGVILTIPAGDSVKQIVEDINIPNGTYTVSWTGTSTVSIDGGASQTSPYTFTIASGTHVEIEFEPGTLSYPNLVPGSIPGVFEKRHISAEKILCQRYYCKTYSVADAPGTTTFNGAISFTIPVTAGYFLANWQFPVAMRTTPTLTAYSGSSGSSGNIYNGTAAADAAVSGFSYQNDRAAPYIGLSVNQNDQSNMYAQITADAEL